MLDRRRRSACWWRRCLVPAGLVAVGPRTVQEREPCSGLVAATLHGRLCAGGHTRARWSRHRRRPAPATARQSAPWCARSASERHLDESQRGDVPCYVRLRQTACPRRRAPPPAEPCLQPSPNRAMTMAEATPRHSTYATCRLPGPGQVMAHLVVPVSTVWSRPLRRCSMAVASAASRGFSKMWPSQTTMVSAQIITRPFGPGGGPCQAPTQPIGRTAPGVGGAAARRLQRARVPAAAAAPRPTSACPRRWPGRSPRRTRTRPCPASLQSSRPPRGTALPATTRNTRPRVCYR